MRRGLALMGALLCAGAGAAETPATQAVLAARGAAGYARSCARCHRDPAKVLEPLTWELSGRAPEERAIWLKDFVLNHHSPGEEGAEALAAYLAGLL
ncbi:MAG: hypothetical protein AB7U46_06785 [Paenirhodobacter sp.]|uniref:hypothetical protein n=1 Tax=Paenirhodobacter sp. TaxID=1965326 RepID=UPI003D125EF5